jgi:hypothetical protein
MGQRPGCGVHSGVRDLHCGARFADPFHLGPIKLVPVEREPGGMEPPFENAARSRRAGSSCCRTQGGPLAAEST